VGDRLVMMTGGLALDAGLVAAMGEELGKMRGVTAKVTSHSDSIYAGAIGAALWGAFRSEKLAASGQMLKAS
jgi:benzoyl-CoA reductase subunit D